MRVSQLDPRGCCVVQLPRLESLPLQARSILQLWAGKSVKQRKHEWSRIYLGIQL